MLCLPNNLPLQLTNFIGRSIELAEVQRLLSTNRLLTLTGVGGCGKTRLSLQAAQMIVESGLQGITSPQDTSQNLQPASSQPQFTEGVWLVELAILSEPAQVVQAVASTLGLREAAGQPLVELLLNSLRSRAILILLDNCEHLLGACAQLAETLLRTCPHLRILATSREALGLAGETTWLTPPLTLPDPESQPGTEEALLTALVQYDAIRLFVARAMAVQPAFLLAEHNQAAVVQVCQSLDGIPLAIELVAAWVKLLALEQIAERLKPSAGSQPGSRSQLLTARSRTVMPRHQTLQAAIDWSHDSLAEPEQLLFRRLSIFAGSFTLEAVEGVCAGASSLPGEAALWGDNGSIPALEPSGVLDLLANLVDKSLVVVEAAQQGMARYRLLETLRQYAWEKLQTAGEVEALQVRRLAFFLRFAEAADAKLRGPEQVIWLQRLDTEYPNLQAALEWSLRDRVGEESDAPVQSGLCLIGALGWFWFLRAHFSEGRAWCEQALAVAGATKRGRAQALRGAGLCAQMQGDYAHAHARLEASLALWQELGDRQGIASTLPFLTWAVSVPGDHAAARLLAEASVALSREVGDRWGLALALVSLGNVIREMGDFAAAQRLFEESMKLFRALGDTWGIAEVLDNLGQGAYYQGDYIAARAWLEEAWALRQPAEDKWYLMGKFYSLGTFARLQGDEAGAVTLFAQSLAQAQVINVQYFAAIAHQQLGFISQRQGNKAQMAAHFHGSLALFQVLDPTEKFLSLTGAIAVAADQQQWERAARLWGAVDALRASLTRPLTPLQEADYTAATASVQTRRNEILVAAAWAQGQTMTLEQAIAEALAPVQPSAPLMREVKAKAPPELRLYALGPARVQRGDHWVTPSEWTYAKARELLFYLLCHPPRSREQIGVDFWPDASPTQLRNSCGVALHHLRQALGRPDWIIFEDDRYTFNRALPYWFDLERLEAHLAQARQYEITAPVQAIAHLEQAVALNQGELLEEFSAGDWYLLRREQLHQQGLEALLSLGKLRFNAGHYERAAAAYRQALARDSYMEAAHQELIRCYARQGERGQALRHYQYLVEFMRDQLGLPPDTTTTALVDRLRRGEKI